MRPFVPEKLPLRDQLDLLYFNNELIEANANIAKYQIMLRYSKVNASLLLNPIMLQEAIQSSKIEGTQTTLDEVLESDVDEEEKNNDVQEVLNYYDALKYAETALSKLPISTRLFKELHRILLQGGVRGGNRARGEYRTIQNFIGPEGCTMATAVFIPPEPQLVSEYISNLEKYINEPEDDLHPLVRIAIIHAQFETIHPFLDGNGRIGRILIPLYLSEQKVLDYPNFFISESLERDKHKYYRLLNDIRFKENWNDWIRFFLQAMNYQAKKSLGLIEDINVLYERDLEQALDVVRNSNIKKIVDVMYQSPIFNVKKMTELSGVADATCRRYLSQLEEARLIYSDDKVRGKKYYYYNLLDLLR